MSKFFQYLRTQTFRKNLITAIIVIALFVFTIFFVLRSYTRHGENIKVPELTNMSLKDAINTLESNGFRYQVDSVYQTDATPGIIIDQDPSPGSNVKTNRTIYITMITMTPPFVNFPEVREMTYLEARAMISNYELKIADTIYIPDIARDVVLDVKYGVEKLLGGKEILKGSIVSLVLGNGMGDSEVIVPDLSGLTLDESTFSIRVSSLTLGSVPYMGYITDSL